LGEKERKELERGPRGFAAGEKREEFVFPGLQEKKGASAWAGRKKTIAVQATHRRTQHVFHESHLAVVSEEKPPQAGRGKKVVAEFQRKKGCGRGASGRPNAVGWRARARKAFGRNPREKDRRHCQRRGKKKKGEKERNEAKKLGGWRGCGGLGGRKAPAFPGTNEEKNRRRKKRRLTKERGLLSMGYLTLGLFERRAIFRGRVKKKRIMKEQKLRRFHAEVGTAPDSRIKDRPFHRRQKKKGRPLISLNNKKKR